MKHSPKYLKREALKCYINDCLTYINYVEIAEFLKEKIINVIIPRFADFSALKWNNICELENYFHKKADIGMELDTSMWNLNIAGSHCGVTQSTKMF